MSKLLAVTATASAFVLSQSAAAQQLPSEELVTRLQNVEAQIAELQKENAELRGEVARLTASQHNAATVQPLARLPMASTQRQSQPMPPPAIAIASLPRHALRWDRAYVGLGVGLSKTHNVSTTFNTAEQANSFTFDRVGESIAIEIGRRWQRGSLVAGFELQGVLSDGGNILIPPDRHILYRTGSILKVKGQLGWDIGPGLAYVTAGPQFTQARNFVHDFNRFNSDYRTSLVYGAGLAIPISNDLSVAFEVTTTSFNPNAASFQSRTRLIDELVSLQLGF